MPCTCAQWVPYCAGGVRISPVRSGSLIAQVVCVLRLCPAGPCLNGPAHATRECAERLCAVGPLLCVQGMPCARVQWVPCRVGGFGYGTRTRKKPSLFDCK